MKNTIPIVIIEFKSHIRTVKYIKDFFENVICNENISFIVVDNGEDCKNYSNIKKEIYNNFKICYEKEGRLLDTSIDGRIKEGCVITVECNKAEIEIIIVKSKGNYGFAIGNNIGAKIAKARYCIEYIIFSNSDIVFKDKFNIDKLLYIFKKEAPIALVGPKMLGLDGQQQSPCEEKNIRQRWNCHNLMWPLNRMLKIKIINNSNDTMFINEDCIVYRIIGAFMLFDFRKFLEIDMFDENTFLYAEELIIAEKLKSLKYKTYYCNNEILIHEQGGTTKKTFNNFQTLKAKFKSEMYYYQKYKGICSIEINFSKFLFLIYCFKYDIYVRVKNIICRGFNL